MKNQIIILTFTLIVSSLIAQQKGINQLPTANRQLPTSTYAVVVGISDYQDPGIPDLRFANKDAEAFANYLRSNTGGKLDHDHLKVLINKEATMAQFANALDWLWEVCKEGDQAIIYFSGHGDVEKKSLTQPGFLLCWDAPARVYMAGGAFALPMLQEVVSTLSVQNKAKVIVITDACRSGTLAGSSVGGSQATAANLAKQFGNEIKIMSCQPSEYSIEGEQWGGGRGAFSFHLIDALYGLADNNNDQFVTLQEIGRYLEDHVTTEVAPVSQVPMIIGNRNERLAGVDEQLLASIKSGKTNQTAMLSAVESRGIEEDVLSKVDTNTRMTYALFKTALKNKIFLEPDNACAQSYYSKLIAEPKLERLHSTMKRNYAAALQDDAQQAINAMLKSDINEYVFTNMRSKAEQYNLYPRNLDRAAELLGSQHYMYKSLKARKYFFEGITMATLHARSGTVSGDIADTIIAASVLNFYRKALDWQTDLAYVYMNLGSVFAYSFNQMDSTEHYYDLAFKNSPSWILGYTALYDIYRKKIPGKARHLLEKADAIDSNTAVVMYKWGEYFTANNKYDSAEMKLLRLLDHMELGFCKPCVHNALGNNYKNAGRYADAEKQYLIGYELDSMMDPILTNMALLYLTMKKFPEMDFFAKKAIQHNPNNIGLYGLAGFLYESTDRLHEADSFYRVVIKLDSFEKRGYLSVANLCLKTGRIKEAENILLSGIRKIPLSAELLITLGNIYFALQQIEKAEYQFNKAHNIDPNNAETHFQLGLVYNQMKRYEESATENRISIKLNPDFPVAYYNLACALSMLNKTDDAFPPLELAIQKGFNEYENMQKDTDLENLRLQKEKWEALMKKYFPDKIKN